LAESLYEMRRLALDRVRRDARGLGADGLLGVRLDLDHDAPSRTTRRLSVTIHVLASAVRRVRRSALAPATVVSLAGRDSG
jgi:uncharacterized protein YbjQ (UPF0145 family)